MILIVTEPADAPANKVEWRLRQWGADVIRFDAADFPSKARVTVSFRDKVLSYTLRDSGRTVELSRVDSIWYRRPGFPTAAPDLAQAAAKDFVELTCREFLGSVWDSFDCRVLPGRPSVMKATQLKAPQLRHAAELGFELPPTLFTNDPKELLDFYREHDGKLIKKATSSLSMQGHLGDHFSLYTEVVTTRDIAYAQSISYCPVILQAYVQKRVELRITVVGRQVFAAEIHSQATHRTRYDWRRYDLASTPHFPHQLPDDLAAKCVALVKGSGLTYGAIDMILTPDGRYVFLELNPSGEYEWIEALTGLPISDAIAGLLFGQPAPQALVEPSVERCHA